jgi:hypothetical protein
MRDTLTPSSPQINISDPKAANLTLQNFAKQNDPEGYKKIRRDSQRYK